MNNLEELERYFPSDLIREVLGDGVKAIVTRDTIKGGGEAYYSPGLDVIVMRKNIDLKEAAKRLTDDLGIDVSEGEVYPFLLLHELFHFQARQQGRVATETECDTFAKKRLSKMRGWKRRFNIQVSIDIPEIIRRGLREAFRREVP